MDRVQGIEKRSQEGDNACRNGMPSELETLVGVGRDAVGKQELGNFRARAVRADENGKVGHRTTRRMVTHPLQHPIQSPCPPLFRVFSDEFVDLDSAFEILAGLLLSAIVNPTAGAREDFADRVEERVVEVNNGRACPPVVLEAIGPKMTGEGGRRRPHHLVFNHFVPDQPRQFLELPQITVAPTVNRLLAIADHEGVKPLRENVFVEADQVVPLGDARVLELVDEEVPETDADAFEDVGGGVGLDQIRNLPIQAPKRLDRLLRHHFLELLGQQNQRPSERHPVTQFVLELQQPTGLAAQRVFPGFNGRAHLGHHRFNGGFDGRGRIRFNERFLARELGRHPNADRRLHRVGRSPSEPFRNVPIAEVLLAEVCRGDGRQGGFSRLANLFLRRPHLIAQLLPGGLKRRRLPPFERPQNRLHVFLVDQLRVRHQRLAHPRVSFLLDLLFNKGFEKTRQLLFARRADPREEPIDRFFEEAFFVELDLEPLIQLQIPGKIPHQTMDKTVNRHHRKIAIMMQHVLPCRPRPRPQDLRRQAGLRQQQRLHCALLPRRQQPDFLQNPIPHLLRRLVGERQRANRPKKTRLFLRQAARQIHLHEPKGLARPRRRPNHPKRPPHLPFNFL